ncbi:hypothetical protein [Ferrovum myxofaciens]|jgi:hypothetical protein|uniref:Uncharacterized protein n=5 Tax=root TaxID=1 RepID=A0A9E6MVA2_9PROT|nr:hypothetical protein [Ferrovum myxofaciens]QKE39032.1 MAG: hypothetical protein HO273_10095 [Ferrovum myxofaciens]QKE41581.1 MAG: hypothetical protein HO274_09845 [Ferrovum myxofaciens]QWY74263.1 MAG: hypothetical protein JVY19_10650 [Ferrovum myxofaciens]QWY77012.1 MAG: hypothetical protein JZL65_11090 [Ferrovum myxofaciens]
MKKVNEENAGKIPVKPHTRSFPMSKDEIRALLLEDINSFRLKAKFYESIRLSEAADYAKDLASNIELALTTMPSDSDSEIY